MKTFEKTTHDIGSVKVGATVNINFPYDNLIKITGIDTPCACTGTIDDHQSKMIIVQYKAAAVPKHLTSQQYAIRKEIRVQYTALDYTEQYESLVLTGIVHE